MKRRSLSCIVLSVLVLAGCNELSHSQVEKLLSEKRIYPKDVEIVLFCNSELEVERVIKAGLVKDGFLTAQPKHTFEDIGKPLIYFTDKANPYLIPTSDTLKSFDEQRIRVGVEHLLQVTKIETNPDGNRAVVDYVTVVKDQTPFSVLYHGDLNTERERRTSFTLTDKGWQWDGRVIMMPGKEKRKAIIP